MSLDQINVLCIFLGSKKFVLRLEKILDRMLMPKKGRTTKDVNSKDEINWYGIPRLTLIMIYWIKD